MESNSEFEKPVKRWRTPQEKKALEYTKDHVQFAESVHGFRKNWPRKKARANRTYRRKIHQVVNSFEARHEDDVPEWTAPATIRREPIRKWHLMEPFGEKLRLRGERKAESAIRNFTRNPYNSDRDRERFARFLEAQVQCHTEDSRRLALHIGDLMDLDQKYVESHAQYWWEKKQEWLRAFLRDEPGWDRRLHAWIASFDNS